MTQPNNPQQYSRLPYVIAILVAISVVLLAWASRGRFEPIIAGASAPAFTVVNEAGDEVTLDDFAGKVVLVNIWATWCPPCVEEMPSLDKLYAGFASTDFEIVAISVDAAIGEQDLAGRPGGNPWEFAKELGVSFPIYWDKESRVEAAYLTTGVPESFIIGRDGVIYKKVSGATVWDHEKHRELIERLLES